MPGPGEIKTQIPGLLRAPSRQIQAVPDPSELPTRLRTPAFGRAVAIALASLFVMVALGVAWVWQRALRDQSWRERVNATESFQAPPKP